MSVIVDPDTRLRGLPFKAWRTLIQRWPRTRLSLWEMGDIPGIDLDPYAVAALIDEAAFHGLIAGQAEHRTRQRTERGDAFAGARIGKRYPRARAERVLTQVLERAARINADPDMPFRVTRIDVYGSFVKPETADVGDLDLYLVTERVGSWDEIKHRYAALSGKDLYDVGYTWSPARVERAQIIGTPKSPVLGHDYSTDPAEYGFAYQRVFDAARGGRVADAVVPERPRLAIRKNLKSPRAGIGLPLSDYRPVHVQWLAPTLASSYGYEKRGPWSESQGLYAQLRQSRLTLHFVSGPEDALAREQDLIGTTIAGHRLDGRSCIALALTESQVCMTTYARTVTPKACAVLKRRVDRTRSGTWLIVEIVDLACCDGGPDHIDDAPLLIACGIYTLIRTDSALVAMIDADSDRSYPLFASLTVALPMIDRSPLAEKLRRSLGDLLNRDHRLVTETIVPN